MEQRLTAAQLFQALFLIANASAMLASFAWVLSQVSLGRRVLPSLPPLEHVVPWNWRTVLVVLIAYYALNLVVALGYWEVKTRYGIQIGHTVTPAAPKEAVRAGVPPGADDPTTKAAAWSFEELLSLGSIVNVSLLVVIPLILLATTRHPLEGLGLRRESLGYYILLGVGAFLLATPWVLAVNVFAGLIFKRNQHPVEDMLRGGLNTGTIVLAYVAAVFLAPLAEEILFRGVLQGWLTRLGQKPESADSKLELFENADPPASRPPPDLILAAQWAWSRGTSDLYPSESPEALLPRMPSLPGFGRVALSSRSSMPIILTSFVFALLHAAQMPAPFAIFFLSLVLGWLKEASGSLVPSIVLHALFNGMNTTLMIVVILLQPSTPDDMKKKDVSPPAKVGNQGRNTTFRLARGEGAVRVECSPVLGWVRPATSNTFEDEAPVQTR
jgi:membrane protease YdiL (CAAX protease family)